MNRHNTETLTAQTNTPHRRRVDVTVLVIHSLIVLSVTGFIACVAMRPEVVLGRSESSLVPAGWTAPTGAIIVCGLGLLALAAVPMYPTIGLWVYVILAYGFDRYSPEYDLLLCSGLLECVAALTALGWAGWMIRRRLRPALPSGLAWVLLALVIWVGISTAASLLSGGHWRPSLRHHPVLFVDALIMFLLSAQFLKHRRDYCLFALILGVTLGVRSVLFPDKIPLCNDLSGLTVVAAPLVILAAIIARGKIVQAAFVLLAMGLLWVLYQTQNRAAAVAVIPVLLVLWLQSRRKVLVLALSLPVILVVFALFTTTDYWQRFADIWREGPRLGGAQGRLNIWRAGLKMASDHPLVGVGPGNFAARIGDYSPALARCEPHNNFLAMLSETGLPGLALYIAFFFGAVGAAWRAGRYSKNAWIRSAACFIAAALVAYLTVGCFLTRHTQTLGYMLAGATVALTWKVPGRKPTENASKTGQGDVSNAHSGG